MLLEGFKLVSHLGKKRLAGPTNIYLPLNSVILFLSIYRIKMSAYVHQKTCIRMLIVSLLEIAKNGNNPKIHR